MAIGQSFAAGYNSTRKAQRSLMPAVNTLSNIIAQRKRGRAVRYIGSSGPSAEERADKFFAEKKAEEDERYARSLIEEQQRKEDEKTARSQGLMQAEEMRRQEAHELDMQAKQQAMSQQGEVFNRQSAKADRAEAYELVKQGLMMRDSKTVNEALKRLAPRGEDVITEGVTAEGARSFKGRPAEVKVPQFIFDPDSDYVGVIFPGQEKPTVFKDAEQAFQNVLAPMNPAHEKTKDQVAAEKNKSEAQFKRKKLTADIHKDAHEAAMQQFEADGYYQPALYDKEKYETAYREYVSRATGQDPSEVKAPKAPSAQQKKAKAPAPEGIYKGEEPPKGFPGARRGKDGGWYVKKGNGWAPVLQGKKKKTGKSGSMSSAGISMRGARPTVIRKKVPQGEPDYFEH